MSDYSNDPSLKVLSKNGGNDKPAVKYPNQFWYPVYKEKKDGSVEVKLSMDRVLFFRFLESHGFFRYYIDGKITMYIRIKDNIITEVIISQIRDFVMETIRKVKDIEGGFNAKDLEDMLVRFNPTLFNESNLGLLKPAELNLLKDTAKESYKFYRNCFVKVTADKIETFKYSQLKKQVWKNQIIDRNFYPIATDKESEFKQLLFLAMGKDEAGFYSICTSLGFLQHSHKDPANAKAIIFTDQKISQPGEANGGSAKSFVASALNHMTSTWYQGKGYNILKSFAWQGVSMDTMVIILDDITAKFPFELLFTNITNGMTIENKGMPAFHLPFADSPKFLLTTNYTVKGEGNSFERRKSLNEFSDYFSGDHSPVDEFGHRLFDDWQDDQWQLFDSFMLECLQLFLANGLREVRVNYDERFLRQNTNPDFVEFFDHEITPGQRIDLAQAHGRFLHQFDYEEREINKRTFYKWVRAFVKYRGIKTSTTENGGISKINGGNYLDIV